MSSTGFYPSIALAFSVRQSKRQLLLFNNFATAFKTGKALAALPFDALRVAYANSVNAGLVENSMLASRNFEHAVGALERVILGPLARRV